MAYIGSYPADRTSGAKPRDEYVGDGSTTTFTLSQEVPGAFESNVIVIVDNVIQQPVESYTIASDNITLTFSEAPTNASVIYVLHQGNATYQMIPVDGIIQTPTTNYTITDTDLIFTAAPDNGTAITVIHLGFSTVSRITVPDGSITSAKLAANEDWGLVDGAVTSELDFGSI